MLRTDIIQFFINKINAKTYLEIGTQQGNNFKKIECESKIGVDPIPLPEFTPTYTMTSDEFFKEFPKKTFDVIFIDGDHHAEQVEKDIDNALNALNPGGVIVCHDMSPTEKVWTLPLESKEFQDNLKKTGSGLWTGDAWKAFVKTRIKYDNLKAFVVDTDFGVAVIHQGTDSRLKVGEELSYENLEKNRQEWLNLTAVADFERVANEL